MIGPLLSLVEEGLDVVEFLYLYLLVFAVFSPPESLQGESLDLWMMIAILSFYSAITLFNVPHMALGAELSEDYHERTRLFGVRAYRFYFWINTIPRNNESFNQ